MSFKFEKLKVWNVALELSNEVSKIAKSFPRIEFYSLSLQMKRAADSVVLNIAEGCILQSNAEFKRYLVIANRSAHEVVAGLHIAITRKYIRQEVFDKLYNGYLNLVKQLQAFIKSLEKNKISNLRTNVS